MDVRPHYGRTSVWLRNTISFSETTIERLSDHLDAPLLTARQGNSQSPMAGPAKAAGRVFFF